MSEWIEKSLNELGILARGKSRHRPRNAGFLYGGTYPFIQTSDVKNANFYLTEYSQTYSEEGLKQSKLWKKGTLCITIAANIADTAILGIDACFPDSILGFTSFDNVSDVRFIKYNFDLLQRKIKQISQGAAQDNLSMEKLITVKFLVPEYPTQRRIASILSAYDDLIENNLKRIKLLEEVAQRTYEEWFIKFRINGEQLEIDEKTGLPAGWEYIKVNDLLGKAPSTIKIPSSEILESGSIPVVDQSRDFIAGFTNDENAYIKTTSPLIVFGDHTRVLKFINFPFARGADGTQLVLSKSPRMPQHLFYHTLLNVDLSNYHYARHFKFLKDSEVILPNEENATQFEMIIKENYDLIKNLRLQNQKLKESRDILLPKLMGGFLNCD